MSIHQGHRQRLRKRFLQEGLDNFDEINALELILFYCMPRQDTNPIAHKLLERFGSLSQVLDASPAELMEVDGVGENVTTFLNMMVQLSRYYHVNHVDRAKYLKTLDACGEYMLPYFIGRPNETVILLCMDAKCKVLCCREVSEGNVNAVGISIRRIMELAMEVKASTVVLAHNHPGGFAIPSHEDIMTTKRLMKALGTIDVVLSDHIIVAENDYVSMAQSGYIQPEDAMILV